jgi:protein TonB
MLRTLFALLTRPAALATSVALHLGVVVAGGHALSEGTEDRPGNIAPVEIEVQLSEPTSAPVPAPTPDERQPVTPVRTVRAGHHHAYPVAPDHDAHPHDPSLLHVARGAMPAALAESTPIVPPLSAQAPASDASSHEAPSSEAPLHFVLAPENLITRGATGAPRAGTTTQGVSDGLGTGTLDAPLSESAVDVPARLLSSIPVVYPEAARAAGIEADVLLELVVDGAGHVMSTRVVSAPLPGLADAAARAIRAYRFTPARRAGRAVPVRMRWTVTFRLQ